jgi:hypothetical protein
MSDLFKTFAAIRRPQLLIRAARMGLAVYRDDRDLDRILGHKAKGEQAVEELLEQEKTLEARRVNGDAAYSIARHIEILIALMAECRWLLTPRPSL